jgi:hypothetical protein
MYISVFLGFQVAISLFKIDSSNGATKFKGWFTQAIFFGNIAEQFNFEARILPSATISWDRKIPIEIALLRNFTMILSR